MADQTQSDLERALYLSEDDLWRQLGATAGEIPIGGDQLQAEDLVNAGKKVMNAIQAQLHELICGTSEEWATERDAIKGGMDVGAAAAGTAIAAALPATALVPPVAVAFVAVLVIRLIYKGTWQATCEVWAPEVPFQG
jgi:hypothetical protein